VCELILEDDVPLPDQSGPDYDALRKAFSSIKVNQSLVFTGSHTYIHALAANSSIRIKVRATEGKVASRGYKEYRIWRIQ
jgi:hypothetical protein